MLLDETDLIDKRILKLVWFMVYELKLDRCLIAKHSQMGWVLFINDGEAQNMAKSWQGFQGNYVAFVAVMI